MPAIDRASLKKHTALLADNFSNHVAFMQQLHLILDHFTNRTMRQSQVSRRISLPTYYSPLPVLQQIEREILPLADNFPEKAAILVTELWKDHSFESRKLAAKLLGAIPPEAAIPILTQLPTFLESSPDREIRQCLLSDSFTRLRLENSTVFLYLLEEWLKSHNRNWQIWGLQALLPILEDNLFENLPIIFKIIRPALESAGPDSQSDISACLVALEKISHDETFVFVRDLVNGTSSPTLIRTLQRVSTSLTPAFQTRLRHIIREQE